MVSVCGHSRFSRVNAKTRFVRVHADFTGVRYSTDRTSNDRPLAAGVSELGGVPQG